MDELLHDLEALKKVADNAGLYLDDENGLAVVRLSLDTSFLEKTTAKHWGVNNRKPVIIELKFDSHTYLRSAEPPAIFIFQSDDPKLSHPALSDYETEFGIVQWFLETRMNKILRANWNRRPASFLEVLPPPPALDLLDDDVAAEIPLEQVDADKTEEDQVALGELFSDEWELRPEGEGKTIHIVKNPRVHDSAFDVGRGPLSGIDDVLLSRRQLIITLDSEEQVITARSAGGVNPSFFRRYHSDQVLSIPAEAQVELRPGDRIWLLENAYPYRVLGPKEAFRTKQQLADQEKGTAGGGDNIKAGEEEEEVEGKRAAPQVDGQRNPPKRQKTFDVDDTSPWAEKAKEVHAILPGIPADKIIAALILKEGDLEQAIEILLSPQKEEPAKPKAKLARSDSQLAKDLQNEFNQDRKTKHAKTQADKKNVKKLRRLGFSEEEAINALEMFGGNLAAVKKGLREEIVSRRQARSQAGEGELEEEEEEEELEEEGEEEAPISEANIWIAKEGVCFLESLFNYINFRFITCVNHCLICDRDLEVAALKLPVCQRNACRRLYESGALMGDVSNEIKKNPEVVDLLINLLVTAATGRSIKADSQGYNRNGVGLANGRNAYGGGNQDIRSFEPFPWGIGFDKGKGKKSSQDIDLLLEVIDCIPSVKDMQSFNSVKQKYGSDEQLKAALDEINPLCFPLLRWILRSNRSSLALLPPAKQVKGMKTKLQFQVVTAFPELEQKFQSWKEQARQMGKGIVRIPGQGSKAATKKGRQSGSYNAWHGSPINNFHSILRTGLRGGHVPGIYHAQNAATSFGYMAVGQAAPQTWANSMWKHNTNVSAIALLEVADHRHNTRLITGGTAPMAINVANNYELVVTRYLFYYPKGPSKGAVQNGLMWGGVACPWGPNDCIANKIITTDFDFVNEEEED